jgi:hypothetical protein
MRSSRFAFEWRARRVLRIEPNATVLRRTSIGHMKNVLQNQLFEQLGQHDGQDAALTRRNMSSMF